MLNMFGSFSCSNIGVVLCSGGTEDFSESIYFVLIAWIHPSRISRVSYNIASRMPEKMKKARIPSSSQTDG